MGNGEESNCDQARKKRSFSPKIDEVKLQKNIDKELDQRFAAIAKRNKDPADQVKILQEKLYEVTFRERLIEKKYEDTRLKLKESFIRENQLKLRCKAQEFQLDGRGTLEYCEKKLFPLWLKNTELSRCQKWAISIFFELTVTAARIRASIPATISAADIGEMVETTYESWSVKFSHKRRVAPPTNEEDWSTLFDCLEVHAPADRVILKSIISTNALEIEFPENENNLGGYIILENISWFARKNQIIDAFRQKNVNILKFMFILDLSGRQTSKITLQVDDLDHIRQVLPQMPSEICAPHKNLVDYASIYINDE